MQGADYWKKRAEQIILSAEQSVLSYEVKLAQAYEVALFEIRKDMDAFFQKYANENKVTYMEARKRLTSVEKVTFNALLKEWYQTAQTLGLSPEFKQYLSTLGKKVYITRLESLEASIKYEIERLKNSQFNWMSELVETNYTAGYYSSYFVFAKGVEGSVNFATINKSGVELAVKTRWDGRNYSDSVWADKARLEKQLTVLLPQSFSRGLSSNEIGTMLAKEFNVSQNRGRTLARTEINYLCNRASLDMYKVAGVESYEFLATLDLRTSEICRGLDGYIGKVSLAKVNVNYPPMHPNCRSTTIPYFADDDIEDRIARNEDGENIKVPRSMTQEKWINTYAPEEQRDSLLKFLKRYPPSTPF